MNEFDEKFEAILLQWKAKQTLSESQIAHIREKAISSDDATQSPDWWRSQFAGLQVIFKVALPAIRL